MHHCQYFIRFGDGNGISIFFCRHVVWRKQKLFSQSRKPLELFVNYPEAWLFDRDSLVFFSAGFLIFNGLIDIVAFHGLCKKKYADAGGTVKPKMSYILNLWFFLKNEIHQKMIDLNLTENFRLILGFFCSPRKAVREKEWLWCPCLGTLGGPKGKTMSLVRDSEISGVWKGFQREFEACWFTPVVASVSEVK